MVKWMLVKEKAEAQVDVDQYLNLDNLRKIWISRQRPREAALHSSPAQAQARAIKFAGVAWLKRERLGSLACHGAAWCGVVRRSVVWRGAAWRAVVWCGVVWGLDV